MGAQQQERGQSASTLQDDFAQSPPLLVVASSSHPSLYSVSLGVACFDVLKKEQSPQQLFGQLAQTTQACVASAWVGHARTWFKASSSSSSRLPFRCSRPKKENE